MKHLMNQVKSKINYEKIIKEICLEDSFELEVVVKEFIKKKYLNIPEIYHCSGYQRDGLKIQVIKGGVAVKFISHQEIGSKLDLFFFDENASGMPFFLPAGRVVYEQMQKIAVEYYNKGDYQQVLCPEVLNIDLWRVSGHLSHYSENMYLLQEDELAIKPMNCPGHILIYKHKKRAASSLPLRVGELGRVHRKELSGSIQGLFRVRSFVVDDAHIFLKEEQIAQEVKSILDDAISLYKRLGFNDIFIKYSSKPEKYVGEDELWNKSQSMLLEVLGDYKFDEKVGDGAFYGPKIDLHLKDSMGREHQVGSIQLDFNLPHKFSLSYDDHQGNKKVPVMIHRAMFGSLERFLGLLLEHHQGWLPLEIAPVQLAILPVSSSHLDYVRELVKNLPIRIKVLSDGSISKRVKMCREQKIPQMIVIGDKEVEDGVYKLQNNINGESRLIKKEELL